MRKEDGQKKIKKLRCFRHMMLNMFWQIVSIMSSARWVDLV